MTREEAIQQLDGAEMMLLNREFKTFNQAVIMAIATLREQEERKNPKPLTLDELRQMDGEPVWLQDNEYETNTRWVIWDSDLKDTWLADEIAAGYGTSWLAYRSKPKEGTR